MGPELYGGIMGDGSKEAGLVEALCGSLAEPGDKELKPAWPL